MFEGGTPEMTYPYGDGAAHNGQHNAERNLRDGECATGKVAFVKADENVPTKQVVYRNGFDETFVWNLDN
ncbi:hypothetical protein [Mariniluteicoccus flavus]